MANELETALIDGGITPVAAKLLSNAINNAAVGLTTTGRQVTDNTPTEQMRQIGPESRRLLFTNLDHPTEGLAARMQVKDGYDPITNPHPYENSQPASADPTLNTPNLLAGDYLNVKQQVENSVAQSEVGLEIEEKGGVHARVNKAKGTIESVPFIVRCEPENLLEAEFIEEDGQTILQIRAKGLAQAARITGFTQRTMSQWSQYVRYAQVGGGHNNFTVTEVKLS
jgi:hypothetical protein